MIKLHGLHDELNKEGPDMTDRLSSTRTPSMTVNLIKAVQDHGVHAIDELNNQIADIEDRKTRLLAERETIQKMLTIAEEHKDHVQR
jgi:hypothetical protein